MSKKNYFSTKQLNKDLKALQKNVSRMAEEATQTVVRRTASEEAFLFSFDEAEVIPFGVGSSGTVVVTANTADPIELEDRISEVSERALDALRQEITEGMKGVLK